MQDVVKHDTNLAGGQVSVGERLLIPWPCFWEGMNLTTQTHLFP